MTIRATRSADGAATFAFVAVLASGGFVPRLGAHEPARLALDDYDLLLRLEDPALSPDGATIALVVGRANVEENRYDRDLVLVDTKSGAQRTLTSARRGLSRPRFSPRGGRLAFLADGPKEGVAQVHVQALGDAGGESRVLTTAPVGVDEYTWSPDGAAIAYSAAEAPEEKTGAARFRDAFEVGGNGLFERAAPRASHLYVVPVTGGEARQLTRGNGYSFSTSLGPSPLAFSPDGREVVAARTISARSGDSETARVHVVEVETGRQRRLTLLPGHEGGPEFSPDGRTVVLKHPRASDPANLTEAFVVPAAGGEPRSVTGALDRSLGLARFLPKGDALLVGANDGTRMGLWVQPLQGVARRLELGPVVEYSGLDLSSSGAVVLLGAEATRPPELYLLDPGQSAPPRRLTDFHAEIAKRVLGRTQGIEWATDDGLTADGALTFPPDFIPDRAWPLVLNIHGGPTAASNEGFDFLSQLLAARGFLVLQPNYRGSDNRGNAFQRAITAGAGEGLGRDVMAGVESLKQRGYVDNSRIAVWGWSYGGFVTGWLVTRYPEAFRAAVMGAAALDLFDMWSLSDLSAQRRHALTESPFTPERLEHYRAQSPLTHATKVKTPTLILTNAADARVAASQSYKFYRALRDNGVETRFFVYPTGGHMPVGPVRQKDVYRRSVEWIEGRFRAR
jgi:dipeptidyl aminopeptidase/acylaminoacyl peptidase